MEKEGKMKRCGVCGSVMPEEGECLVCKEREFHPTRERLLQNGSGTLPQAPQKGDAKRE